MDPSKYTLWLVVLVPGRSGWSVQLVDIVISMGFQSPSGPSVLPFTLPLESLGSAQWLTVSASVLVRFWQNLSRDSHIRLLSVGIFWHHQQCLGFVSAYGMDPWVLWSLDGLCFRLFSIFFCPCLGGIPGSRYICSRGRPYLASTGGEALGTLEA